MVICLERDADLRVAQRIPLPLTVSCFSKIQVDFTFLVPPHPGSPGQRAIKRVCVCVCVCIVSANFWYPLIDWLSWRVTCGRQGSQVETAINKFNNKDVRWSSQGMIRLSLDAMKRLFDPTVERIKQAVHDVVNNVPGRLRFRFHFQS